MRWVVRKKGRTVGGSEAVELKARPHSSTTVPDHTLGSRFPVPRFKGKAKEKRIIIYMHDTL